MSFRRSCASLAAPGSSPWEGRDHGTLRDPPPPGGEHPAGTPPEVGEGAELRVVDRFVPGDHPESIRSAALRFVDETPGAWFVNQYGNPANPAAHWETTGPEIWQDTEGKVTHLVSTIGTDPETSSYSGGDGSAKHVEGAGHVVHPDAAADVWPESFDPSVVDRYVPVSDREAIETIRRLARLEGILGGGSAGVALAAAFRIAEDLDEDSLLVVVVPDSGRSYLSTYYDEGWLLNSGYRSEAGGATIGDEAIVFAVFARDRTIAPHPSEVAGWLHAGDLRRHAAEAPATPLQEVVRPAPPAVASGQSVAGARARLAADAGDWRVAMVLDAGRVVGIVTPEDLPA